VVHAAHDPDADVAWSPSALLMVDGIGAPDGTAARSRWGRARHLRLRDLLHHPRRDRRHRLGRTSWSSRAGGLGKLSPTQFDGVVLLLNTLWSIR